MKLNGWKAALTLALGTTGLLEAQQAAGPASAPGTTSVVPEQISIYGGDGAIRASMSSQASDLRKEFSAVLRCPETMTFQWVLQMVESDGSSRPRQVAGLIYRVPPTYRFEVNVRLGPDLTVAEFQSEFVRMLLLEKMYTPPTRPISQDKVPAWLQAGVEELMHFRRRGRPSDIYAYLIQNREVMSITDVMKADPAQVTDSVSQRVYRACAAALVQALLDQVRGPLSLQEFMQDLAVETTDPRQLLQRHFPALSQEEKSLEKWWMLQMASMSQRSALEYLDIAESEQFLDQALTVRFKEFVENAKNQAVPPAPEETGFFSKIPQSIMALPGSIKALPGNLLGRGGKTGGEFELGRVHDFEKFLHHPLGRDVLRSNREQLLQIRDRVFPLYRPIVAGYDNVLGRLVEGDTKDAAEDLAELDRQRADLRLLMENITDHMNWFATTQVDTESDAFDGYESALRHLKGLERKKRTDPISNYLNAVEREFAP